MAWHYRLYHGPFLDGFCGSIAIAADPKPLVSFITSASAIKRKLLESSSVIHATLRLYPILLPLALQAYSTLAILCTALAGQSSCLATAAKSVRRAVERASQLPIPQRKRYNSPHKAQTDTAYCTGSEPIFLALDMDRRRLWRVCFFCHS